VRDYETDNPGFGYSAGYRQPNATTTVYIYDLKRRDIPDDPLAPVIKAELEATKADILRTQQSGAYLKVESKDAFSIADAQSRTRFLCAAFKLTRSDGALASYACVGGWNGKFIKFRITAEQQSEVDARGFVRAWIDLLWPS
jgi:hypothetical protein